MAASREDEFEKPPAKVNDRVQDDSYRTWVLHRHLGEGAYGVTFEAFDLRCPSEKRAIKIQPAMTARTEEHYLRQTYGCRHVLSLEGKGVYEPRKGNKTWPFLVLQLLSNDLYYLHELCKRRFSLSTTVRLAKSTLRAIEETHKRGIVHRDIKASNFAMSIETAFPDSQMKDWPTNAAQSQGRCYLLDFGMARSYIQTAVYKQIADKIAKQKEDDTQTSVQELAMNAAAQRSVFEIVITEKDFHEKERRVVHFRGTPRYASADVHDETREYGPVDDLWSWFYMIVEFRIGQLPWAGKPRAQLMSLKRKHKENLQWLSTLEPEFVVISEYLKTLSHRNIPNYNYLHGLLRDLMKTHDIAVNQAYDWALRSVPKQENDHQVMVLIGGTTEEEAKTFVKQWEANPCRSRPRRHPVAAVLPTTTKDDKTTVELDLATTDIEPMDEWDDLFSIGEDIEEDEEEEEDDEEDDDDSPKKKKNPRIRSPPPPPPPPLPPSKKPEKDDDKRRKHRSSLSPVREEHVQSPRSLSFQRPSFATPEDVDVSDVLTTVAAAPPPPLKPRPSRTPELPEVPSRHTKPARPPNRQEDLAEEETTAPPPRVTRAKKRSKKQKQVVTIGEASVDANLSALEASAEITTAATSSTSITAPPPAAAKKPSVIAQFLDCRQDDTLPDVSSSKTATTATATQNGMMLTTITPPRLPVSRHMSKLSTEEVATTTTTTTSPASTIIPIRDKDTVAVVDDDDEEEGNSMCDSHCQTQ